MMAFPLTLNWIRHRVATQFSDTEVVSRLSASVTVKHSYRSMVERSVKLAQALLGLGLAPGTKVATLMWNHHAHLEAYLGVPAAGAVLHTLNHRLSTDDLAYIANHAQDQVLLIDDTLLPVYNAIKDKVPTLSKVIVFNSGGTQGEHLHEDYERWLASADSDISLPEIEEDAPATLCYTGGSTGRPKGVLYTHRALVMHAFCQSMVDGYGIGRQDTVLGVVPMFHGNGWGLPFSAMLTGARLILPGSRVDAASVLQLINQERVTFSAGVPTVWLDLLNALEASEAPWKRDWPLTILTGGAAPPESMFDRFKRFDVSLKQGWGMTETASVITVSAPNRFDAKEAEGDAAKDWRFLQGKPMAVVDVRIADEQGALPSDGKTVGEVQVRGSCVTDHYYNQDLSERWTSDGWLRTGDLGTIDTHGNLQVLERKEDMIKSGGEWIIPQELENSILTYPGVQEATVIAVPHDRWGERPVALVVPSPGASVDAQSLKAHLAQFFAKWQLPDEIFLLPSIPRTPVGKVARRDLRDRYKDVLKQSYA